MRVLVANRGEIAVRIVRACRELGMQVVVAHSDADRDTCAVALADRGFCIGPGPATASYLDMGAVLTAATATGADAIHPGYGFLSESAQFAETCAKEGFRFIGPSAEAIRLMGDKVSARRVAESADVPVVPGAELSLDLAEATSIVPGLGNQVMIKAAAGGGGRGMRLVDTDGDIAGALEIARAEAITAFGDGTLYAERYVANGRHVEIQVFGLGEKAVNLGERDCSVQRRHQKLIEESPCGVITDDVRNDMAAAAVRLTEQVQYLGAGTVEFLWDKDAQAFYFLEMNTRLQVEHGVTEMRGGLDLVRQQLLMADTGHCELDPANPPATRGHVMEARVLAEDPARDFAPTPGDVTEFQAPAGPGVRVDTFLRPGARISPFYDSMIAKVLVEAGNRPQAIARMIRALDEFQIGGLTTNIPTLKAVLANEDFLAERHTTSWFDRHYRADGKGINHGNPDNS